MSIRMAKWVLFLFICAGLFSSVWYIFEENLGGFIFSMGGVLMFSFIWGRPQIVLITHYRELESIFRDFKLIDYAIIWTSITLGLSGVILNLVT